MADVSWTVRSGDDLDGIAAYISRQSPRYAPIFVQRIIGSVERLRTFPLAGRIVPEFDDPDIREVIFQNYRIVYRVQANDSVQVLGVFHGSIDLKPAASDRGWSPS